MAKIFYSDIKKEVGDFVGNIVQKKGPDSVNNSNVDKDSKGKLAKAIDFLTIRLLAFLVLGFIASGYTSVLNVFIFAVAGTILTHFLLAKRSKKINEIYRDQERQNILHKHALNRILKMDAEKEFKIFISQVLNRLEDFSKIHVEDKTKDGIDIKGYFKDEYIGVRCKKYKEEEVGQSEVINFASHIKDNELSKGILITTSTFSDEAIDVIPFIKNNYEIQIALVDKKKLLEWVKRSKHSIFPNDYELEDLEQKEKQEGKMTSLKRRELINKNLMRSFLLITVYLTILSFLLRGWLQDWMIILYFSIAVVNLILALVFFYLYRSTKETISQFTTLNHNLK